MKIRSVHAALLAGVAGAAAAPFLLQAWQLGYSDTPLIPEQKWRVHDISRPHPAMVTPAATVGGAPSDAVKLFDGKDLSQWVNKKRGKESPAGWKVADGYFEITPGTGDLVTKEKFGDVQLHLEWASPAQVQHSSQARGNSGVLLMHRYEIQVLDSWENPTYADGQAGSIYGQWPPMVNPVRKPGEWQTYDMVFEAPKFEGSKLATPAYATVFLNGIVLHNRKAISGPMAHKVNRQYEAHGEEPLGLQDHDTPVRFRNVWVRRLKGYDLGKSGT